MLSPQAIVFLAYACSASLEPYLSLYLQDKHFSAPLVGVVLAALRTVALVCTPLVCAFADRHHRQPQTLCAAAFISAAVMAALCLSNLFFPSTSYSSAASAEASTSYLGSFGVEQGVTVCLLAFYFGVYSGSRSVLTDYVVLMSLRGTAPDGNASDEGDELMSDVTEEEGAAQEAAVTRPNSALTTAHPNEAAQRSERAPQDSGGAHEGGESVAQRAADHSVKQKANGANEREGREETAVVASPTTTTTVAAIVTPSTNKEGGAIAAAGGGGTEQSSPTDAVAGGEGDKTDNYANARLWGSVSYGVCSAATGLIVSTVQRIRSPNHDSSSSSNKSASHASSLREPSSSSFPLSTSSTWPRDAAMQHASRLEPTGLRTSGDATFSSHVFPAEKHENGSQEWADPFLSWLPTLKEMWTCLGEASWYAAFALSSFTDSTGLSWASGKGVAAPYTTGWPVASVSPSLNAVSALNDVGIGAGLQSHRASSAVLSLSVVDVRFPTTMETKFPLTTFAPRTSLSVSSSSSSATPTGGAYIIVPAIPMVPMLCLGGALLYGDPWWHNLWKRWCRRHRRRPSSQWYRARSAHSAEEVVVLPSSGAGVRNHSERDSAAAELRGVDGDGGGPENVSLGSPVSRGEDSNSATDETGRERSSGASASFRPRSRSALQVYVRLFTSVHIWGPVCFTTLACSTAECVENVFLFPYARRVLNAPPALFSTIMLLHTFSEMVTWSLGPWLLHHAGVQYMLMCGALSFGFKQACYAFVDHAWTLAAVEAVHGLCFAVMYTAAVAQVQRTVTE